MEVTITSAAGDDSSPVVEFNCLDCTGRGVWRTGAPRVGERHHVELEVDQPLRLGINLKPADVAAPRLHASEGLVTLVARIENVFEEETACLRLGDSLVTVEYEGALPAVGTWVEVSVPRIELYDTNM